AFFAKGQKRPPFVVADTARRVAAQNDSTGQPFWWGGQPALLENPQVVDPRGGHSYAGSGWLNSGVPVTTYTRRFLRTGTDGFLNSGLLDGDTRTSLPGTTTIRFTSPGTYTIASALHPGMTATVNVSG